MEIPGKKSITESITSRVAVLILTMLLTGCASEKSEELSDSVRGGRSACTNAVVQAIGGSPHSRRWVPAMWEEQTANCVKAARAGEEDLFECFDAIRLAVAECDRELEALGAGQGTAGERELE